MCFPQGGPVDGLGVGFLNNHFPLGVGGEGDEPVRMPRPFEFQITDAIAHRDCSHVRPQTELLDDFWLPAISRKGMVLIKANADVPIPEQHIGMDLFGSKAKRE